MSGNENIKSEMNSIHIKDEYLTEDSEIIENNMCPQLICNEYEIKSELIDEHKPILHSYSNMGELIVPEIESVEANSSGSYITTVDHISGHETFDVVVKMDDKYSDNIPTVEQSFISSDVLNSSLISQDASIISTDPLHISNNSFSKKVVSKESFTADEKIIYSIVNKENDINSNTDDYDEKINSIEYIRMSQLEESENSALYTIQEINPLNISNSDESSFQRSHNIIYKEKDVLEINLSLNSKNVDKSTNTENNESASVNNTNRISDQSFKEANKSIRISQGDANENSNFHRHNSIQSETDISVNNVPICIIQNEAEYKEDISVDALESEQKSLKRLENVLSVFPDKNQFKESLNDIKSNKETILDNTDNKCVEKSTHEKILNISQNKIQSGDDAQISSKLEKSINPISQEIKASTKGPINSINQEFNVSTKSSQESSFKSTASTSLCKAESIKEEPWWIRKAVDEPFDPNFEEFINTDVHYRVANDKQPTTTNEFKVLESNIINDKGPMYLLICDIPNLKLSSYKTNNVQRTWYELYCHIFSTVMFYGCVVQVKKCAKYNLYTVDDGTGIVNVIFNHNNKNNKSNKNEFNALETDLAWAKIKGLPSMLPDSRQGPLAEEFIEIMQQLISLIKERINKSVREFEIGDKVHVLGSPNYNKEAGTWTTFAFSMELDESFGPVECFWKKFIILMYKKIYLNKLKETKKY